MMLRVNNEYLDFDDVVEVEKQVKLLESIDTADGDFSYQFSLPRTINNIKILGNPQPDNISKPVYQRIDAALLNDSGAELFKGYLRVERLKEVIDCSFFAGNNNWFGLLAGNLQDLDWSEFDLEISESNFAAAIFNTEGVVLPLIDNGVLVSRGTTQLKLEDFVAGIYVKSVFEKVFNSHGIKIQGELLDDVNFNAAITVKSGKSQEDIDDRSSFVHSTNSPNPNDDTYRKAVFTNDSVFPYFDGAQNNYNLALSRYVADVKMKVKVEFQIFDIIASTGVGLNYWMAIRKNGVQIKEFYVIDSGFYPAKISMVVTLNPGVYLGVKFCRTLAPLLRC